MKRIFIALPIQSEEALQLATTWRNNFTLNINRLAWTNPSTWHLTLYFLGPTDQSQLVILQQLLDISFNNTPSFTTQINRLGLFPEKGRPRILWLGFDNLEPLLPAYAVLGDLLLKNGFLFDPKPLKPHLTLARIKELSQPKSIDDLQNDYQTYHFGNVDINRVTLFESLSTSNGVIYQPLYEKGLHA